MLLSGSLRENIQLGKPEAAPEQLRQAAATAGCDFGEDGEGLEREVGEQGLQMSGGQKQRVALARVLLRDSPIVVIEVASSPSPSAAAIRL